jgi:hypothetical protein
MHRINELFREITDELWDIKHYASTIQFKDLIDFYKEYQFHKNLAIDAINAQIIQYDGKEMPFSEQDISYFIEACVLFNGYKFDRLLVEALFVLDNEKAYQYLNKILDTDEKRVEFKREFSRWTHFERAVKELKKLSNPI